jgi:RNA polymerase sigma factor (sigma-70 family)
MTASMTNIDQAQRNSAKHWNDLVLSVARARDRAAFESLFEHFAPLIKAYAFKVSDLAQAEALAEELVQETMIKVWLKAETFNADKSAAGTWIFTIARNTRIDLLRKNARQWETNSEEFNEDELNADDIWFQQSESYVMESVSESKQEEALMASLESLSEEQALIVRTIFLEGLSHSEAAKLLGLPLGTVKSRVRLALQKLKLSMDI